MAAADRRAQLMTTVMAASGTFISQPSGTSVVFPAITPELFSVAATTTAHPRSSSTPPTPARRLRRPSPVP
ncbi:hypothetical protein E2C01_098621 [Portunus trituberculatus]|uniref:Uncharacterized protein n=1 Tax=Portunus trituberculatus TaxID=210409 RepID=A0A5B7KCK1_PORTR|nr:hypothetical protein [Portunus trituberculatus]